MKEYLFNFFFYQQLISEFQWVIIIYLGIYNKYIYNEDVLCLFSVLE